MKLGFVSAILPELTLEEVLNVAANEGYDCVEIMCWPKGKASRRYAGITHIDVSKLGKKEADSINALCKSTGVSISALGYYPNPLSPNAREAKAYCDHLKLVIKASNTLGINRVNTFIGRDWKKTIDDNWPQFLKTWKPIIKYAEKLKVKVGIENCPMSFGEDEWPGGQNLAISPSVWNKMFKAIPSNYFGLNYDPSHMILQHMDAYQPIVNFSRKLFHVHAKDLRIDTNALNEVGIFDYPKLWHTPKLPGLGDVNWGKFFSHLTDIKYTGAVCVEVEDRAFEGTYKMRITSLRLSANYLRQYIPKL